MLHVVDFQVTPLSGQKPVIYFNTNSTVRRLVLPRNGRIVLKPSITIQLTANESCESNQYFVIFNLENLSLL